MSLALTIVFASRARSTHHKLALDALRHLQNDRASAWRNLFIAHHKAYLEGAKAPDTVIKDFRNHVLHVGDNYWGGAPAAAREWATRAVEAFQAEDWRVGVYAAGVMSHYYVDPIQPFHTAQSEAEGALHRSVEWSFNKAYGEMKGILEHELAGYPAVDAPDAPDWLERMVRAGAEESHPHYDTVIDHYDLEAGRKKPVEGLDQELKDRIARLIGYAIAGLAAVLDKLVSEAGVEPPQVDPAPAAIAAALDTPRQYVLRAVGNAVERAKIAAVYKEYEDRGKVIDKLSEDDKIVRRLHAEEVLGVSEAELNAQPARKPGALHGVGAAPRKRDPITGAMTIGRARLDPTFPRFREDAERKPRRAAGDASTPRFYLSLASPVVDAPSIGPKTAERLAAVAIRTVSDLLNADAAQAAERLEARHITAKLIVEWQDQARLVARVPGLRGHDAQILTACGVTSSEALAVADLDQLAELTTHFVETPQGKRILRSSTAPDRDEITGWIEAAQDARVLSAA